MTKAPGSKYLSLLLNNRRMVHRMVRIHLKKILLFYQQSLPFPLCHLHQGVEASSACRHSTVSWGTPKGTDKSTSCPNRLSRSDLENRRRNQTETSPSDASLTAKCWQQKWCLRPLICRDQKTEDLTPVDGGSQRHIHVLTSRNWMWPYLGKDIIK